MVWGENPPTLVLARVFLIFAPRVFLCFWEVASLEVWVRLDEGQQELGTLGRYVGFWYLSAWNAGERKEEEKMGSKMGRDR